MPTSRNVSTNRSRTSFEPSSLILSFLDALQHRERVRGRTDSTRGATNDRVAFLK